jgi:diguanylate cyclase (GGDEF)-like protein
MMNGQSNTTALEIEDQEVSQHLDLAREAFRLTEFGKALAYAEKALEPARAGGDRVAEAIALSWVGAALTQQSRYQEALVRLKESLDLLDDLGRLDLSALALNYQAVVYEELGDLDTALGIYQKGFGVASAIGDCDLAGRTLGNIGQVYVSLRKYDTALPYLERACALLKAVGSQGNLGWCLLVIARIHAERGEDEKALHYFRLAVEAAEASGALRTQAEVRTGLGSFYAKAGDYESAASELYLALDLAEKAGVKRQIFKTHLALAEAHEKFSDYERSLHHYKAFHLVRSAVFDEVTKAKIGSLTAAMDLEKERFEREVFHLRNVELAEALAKLKEQAEELERLSSRDDLTGVFNRRYLAQALAAEMKRCRRYGSPLSVAIADADHFKQINDRFSHAVGDKTLRQLARIMESHLRHIDLLARYGGEEFVLVLPETPLNAAVIACERIRLAIERFNWSQIHPSLRLTASIGIATYTKDQSEGDVQDWEKLLSLADEKLFEAKRRGRNRVRG